MAHNIIYSPWERTKGPWLCLMTALLLLISFECFPLFSHFSLLLIKFILWLTFSTDRRQAEDMVWRGKDHRVLLWSQVHCHHGQGGYRIVNPTFQLAAPHAGLPTFIITLLASWGPHENMESWMSTPSILTEPRCLVRAMRHKARK